MLKIRFYKVFIANGIDLWVLNKRVFKIKKLKIIENNVRSKINKENKDKKSKGKIKRYSIKKHIVLG